MTREIRVYGLSHHGTPVSVRERLASGEHRVIDDLGRLVDGGALDEGVLLSTCNRVEVVATTSDAREARRQVLGYFNQRAAPERVESYVYEYDGLEAVKHLFRVASGLDSMVLGEPQILGQVKEAYATATKVGSTGTLLSRCFDRSFKVAKRVRSETGLAAGNVSISSIACELAEKIFGDLVRRRVLLVGAGKMSEAAARSLTARGAELTVVNRNPERARSLAEACGGRPRPLEALATELAEADVVISSTAKEGYVITHELMQGVVKMRKFRQLFLIDIAVPRDIDPRVDGLRNVFLYDMDDLKRVSHANMSARERAASDAEAIIGQEVAEYGKWLDSLELTPTIVALRNRVREVVLREKDKALPRLGSLDARQAKALNGLCESIVNQLLHAPLTRLKQDSSSGEPGDGMALVEAVQELFALDVDTPGRAAPDPSKSRAAAGERESMAEASSELATAESRARRS
ncbi:MAG: glutamyl-tRNA reductase [Myxococcales bacterium]|nr:glutamyl-tRNA reductase [Myxococcales bacterium]